MDADLSGGPSAPQGGQESAQVPMQTRRTAAPNGIGPATPLSADHPGRLVPELYAAGRSGVPGQRSAP